MAWSARTIVSPGSGPSSATVAVCTEMSCSSFGELSPKK